LVNNLNDGMAWGLLPLYFAARGLPLTQISILGSLYPAVWGVARLGTGALSDRLGRKTLIASGMVVQAVAIAFFVALEGFVSCALAAVLLRTRYRDGLSDIACRNRRCRASILARIRAGSLPSLA
jgi:MFS family permease